MKVTEIYLVHSYPTLTHCEGRDWVFKNEEEAEKFYDLLPGSKDMKTLLFPYPLFFFETEQDVFDYVKERVSPCTPFPKKNEA